MHDLRNFPDLYVSRIPNDWNFNNSRGLHIIVLNNLCDYRYLPGLPSCVQKQWSIVTSHALLTMGSTNLENKLPLQNFCDTNSLWVYHHRNTWVRPSRMFNSIHSVTHRECLQLLRFWHLRILFGFTHHVYIVLQELWYHFVVRAICKLYTKDILVQILIYGKIYRKDASRAIRIKRRLMRAFMRRHDFHVYMWKYPCRLLLFPWLLHLTLRLKKFMMKTKNRSLCIYFRLFLYWYLSLLLYHQLLVQYQLLCWNICTSLHEMAHKHTDIRNTSLFRSQNIAHVIKEEPLEFNSEPPNAFVYHKVESPARIKKKKIKSNKSRVYIGGGISRTLPGKIIKKWILNRADPNIQILEDDLYVLKRYIHEDDLVNEMHKFPGCIVAQVPVHILTDCMTIKDLKELAKVHKVTLSHRENKEANKTRFKGHDCENCMTHYSLFTRPTKANLTPEKKKQDCLLPTTTSR